MRNWVSLLILGQLCISIWAQGTGRCPFDPDSVTAEEIIYNPPPNWDFGCLTEKLIDSVIYQRQHVYNVVQCLKDVSLCSQTGYELIAEEILNRIGNAGNCFNCDSELNKLVESSIRKLQKAHPKLLREGLAYLT